jgi:glycosyltransferase involved in cell wall biosynthesis
MKIFIIPSWQPSNAHPTTGIFFQDQAKVLSSKRPKWLLGLSEWGSHEPKLWLSLFKPLDFFLRKYSKPPIQKIEELLAPNLVRFVNPRHTWTRKFLSGNLPGIIQANQENLERFVTHFGKPDVIHAQVSFPAGYIASQLSIKNDIPYVITEHMSPFPMRGVKDVFAEFILPSLRNADAVIVVSQHLREKLKEYQIEGVQLVSNFINEEFFEVEDGNNFQRQGNGKKLLLAVGRLEEQKNYELLLRTISSLVLEGEDLYLKIAGEGSERNPLEKLIQELGLHERVTLLGDLEKEALKPLLKSADRFISSSLHENLPVAIIEALASGLPIISTPWLGASTMLENEIACISDQFEVNSLSKAIRQSISHQYDKKLIRQYYLNHFGNELVIQKLEEVFVSLINDEAFRLDN